MKPIYVARAQWRLGLRVLALAPGLAVALGAFKAMALSSPAKADATLASELLGWTGHYKLLQSESGDCRASLDARIDYFLNDKTDDGEARPGLGIYGPEPGDVIFQFSAVNQGRQEEDVWYGRKHIGTEWSDASLEGTVLKGEYGLDDPKNTPSFKGDFSGSLADGVLRFHTTYDNNFNDIGYEMTCSYAKGPKP